MRNTSLLAAPIILALAVPVHAEVYVSTPWATVHVGRPLPPVIVVPADAPPLPPAPVRVEGPPLIEAPPLAARPMTLEEFAASFRPAPGHYEVVLLNPVTCCPVKVCFTLPCGCASVRVHDKSLVFHYGLLDNVSIHFHHDGRVTVHD